MAVAAMSATAICLDIGMTIAVGIFELFTYAIPGSLYLAFFAYVVSRAHWVDLPAVTRAPVFLLVVAVIVISYLLGYLAYPLGQLTEKLVPRLRHRDARAEFVRRVPVAKDREYVQEDPFILLAGIQLHDKEVEVDISRIRAIGLMLRNCAPPLLLATVAAIIEVFIGRSVAFAICSAVAFPIALVGAVVQSRRLSHWAKMRTLETGFWLPDVDEKFRKMES